MEMTNTDLGFEAFLRQHGVYRSYEHAKALAELPDEVKDLVYEEEGLLKDSLPHIEQYCDVWFSWLQVRVRDCSMRGSKLAIVLSEKAGTYVSVHNMRGKFILMLSINNATVETIELEEDTWISTK
jgi:hypothetical protein